MEQITAAPPNSFQYERVWEIHNKLHPKPEDFLSPTRFFVREGKMWFKDEKKKKKKKRHFFLFNDVLLFCRREGVGRYYLRIYITLRAQNVSVEDINVDFQFRLKTRQRSFILFAPSAQQRKEWLQDLNSSIQGTHIEELRQKSKAGVDVASQVPKLDSGTITQPEELIKKDLVQDLMRENTTKNTHSRGTGKKKGQEKEKEKDSESSSGSSNEDSDSDEVPRKSRRNSKCVKKPTHQVGDLLGLGSEIISVAPTPVSPRGMVQAQVPFNPFLAGIPQPTTPFVINTPAPLISPRAPASGFVSPRSGITTTGATTTTTTTNPFQQQTAGTKLVNPFLN